MYVGRIDGNDIYTSEMETIEEVIKDLVYNLNEEDILINNGNKTIEVNIGIPEYYQDFIDAENILDDLYDKAFSESEYAEEYLSNVSEDGIEWLQNKLNELWDEFKKRENIKSPFFYIQKERTFIVYIEEVEQYSYEILHYEEIKK